MKNYLVLVVVLALSACMGSGDVPESEKTVAVKFSVEDEMYWVVKTVDGWKSVPQNKEVSYEIPESGLQMVDYCPGSDSVRVSRQNLNKITETVNFDGLCESGFNTFLESLDALSLKGVVLPVGSDKSDLGGEFLNVGNLDEGRENTKLELSKALKVDGSSGKLALVDLVGLNSLNNYSFDFTVAEDIYDYSETYDFNILYPSETVKNKLLNKVNISSSNVQLNGSERAYISPYSEKDVAKLPKSLTIDSAFTGQKYVNVWWNTPLNSDGASIQVEQYLNVNFGVDSTIEFPLEFVPSVPESNVYSFNGEELTFKIKGYSPQVDSVEFVSMGFEFKTNNADKVTKWTFVGFSPNGVEKDLEFVVPDTSLLPSFPEEVVTLKKSGFSFIDAQPTYQYRNDVDFSKKETRISLRVLGPVISNK